VMHIKKMTSSLGNHLDDRRTLFYYVLDIGYILSVTTSFYKLNGVTEVASSEISQKSQKFEKQFS
ncbi:hypothetical protein, partial [Vagococcus fluvialis]|uniref:hypothetical protein n=1 Tax=Vagococcus fluvialis TaxID=2738 RepID=UPI0037A63C2D